MLDKKRPTTLLSFVKHRIEQNNKDVSLWLCPICGNRYKAPRSHVYRTHLLCKIEFEQKYGKFPES